MEYSITPQAISAFHDEVWTFFKKNQRTMPWRSEPTPYYVLVSEFMLQQTQVSRVIPKFEAFMGEFPTVERLAQAPLAAVLTAWSGLGYNRRAKFLHETARTVVSQYGGTIPSDRNQLVGLPGIGQNTAGAILVYAFEKPEIFIETNIRTVLFHHFCHDEKKISDKELIAIATKTFDVEHPREWYWALMDYGTYLKRTRGGRLAQSKIYKKQTPLRGSLREMRGLILKHLTEGPRYESELTLEYGTDKRFETACIALIAEGFVVREKGRLCLTGSQDAR